MRLRQIFSKQVLQFINTEVHHIVYDSVNGEDLSNCLDMICLQNLVHFALELIKYELILQQCTNNDNVFEDTIQLYTPFI